MNKSSRLVGIGFAAVAFHVAAFAVYQAKPEWFQSAPAEQSGTYTDIADIVDGIRASKLEKWQEVVDDLQLHAQEMAQLREDGFARYLKQSGEPDDLQEYKLLSANAHVPLDKEFPATSDQDLTGLLELAKRYEADMVNNYRDLLGIRQMTVRRELHPIDAVAEVQLVAPKRISLDAAAITQHISNRHDGRLAQFKEQLIAGRSELDAISKHADRLLEQANAASASGPGAGFTQITDPLFNSNIGPTLDPDRLNPDDDGIGGGNFDPLGPGRHLAGVGSKYKNLYVDRWYVMGPFPSRFRTNLDASFLPETVIDLGSTTKGKDGRQLRWEYWRRKQVRIEPESVERDVIYYGWSEIYVEKAGRYWVSLGSDDYGKLWVNDELVWTSCKDEHAFDAAEDTRELDLKQGVNQLLFRCENSGGTMGWSVVFHLHSSDGDGESGGDQTL